MFCTNCGKQIPDTVKFCTYCGTKIEPQEEVIYSAPTQPEAAPIEPAVYAAPKKSSKLPIIIAIIVTVILLVVGIFAVSKLIDNLDLGGSVSSQERVDRDDEEEEDEREDEEREEEEREEEKREEEQTEPMAEAMPEEEAAADNTLTEEILAEAAALAEAGDIPAAMDMIRTAQEVYGDDPAYQEVLAMYQAFMETEPPVLTTADLVSNESITPLLEQALEMRAKADAKWDHKQEIPGECEYNGYIYMENPENGDDNRLYLVFVMNATIKDVPIQFVYWVFYDDIAFDDAGTISYKRMGSSNDDGYTVKTAFGSYYSYYGLDDYDMFYEKIILTNGYELVDENVWNVVIKHPVSDTYN